MKNHPGRQFLMLPVRDSGVPTLALLDTALACRVLLLLRQELL